MAYAQPMAQTSPQKSPLDAEALVEGIRACFDCAQACTACADACLGERQVQRLTRCIRLNLDCADVCVTTGRLLSRQTAFEPSVGRALLQACAQICAVCGDECEQHGQHGMEHCRVCAEACRRCEQACNTLLSKVAAS
jgi:uncharacterized protein DUF326